MKKNKIIKTLLYCFVFAAFITACDDDDEASVAEIDFAGISSNYHEIDGTVTVTLPVRGGANASDLDFEFDGTATEGEDFEFVGFTSEGVQIKLIDDNDLELAEKLRIRMVSPNLNLNGNSMHTISLISNCEDTENPFIEHFAGNYDATEKYGPTEADWYGPYEITLVQDETDPNKFHFDNLYDSGCDAYMIFDLAAGTVYFPDQAPCDVPLTNSSGTFTLTPCMTELTINLNFDGGDWVYHFAKK